MPNLRAEVMGWLKWREVLKPSGQYDRTLFLFWFSVPIICVVPIVANIWEFEKLLIRLSFYIGLLGFNAYLACQILSVLLVLFLIYLVVIAMAKRCNDLGQSSLWIFLVPVPIVGMAFLVYLLFWPCRASRVEARKRGWPRTIATSMAAVVVFILFAISSLFFELYTAFKGLSSISADNPVRLRIWNQADEALDVEFVISDGIVYQQYPADKVKPDDIVKNENILFRQGKYFVTAKNARGKTVYSKGINSEELAKANWIILISEP